MNKKSIRDVDVNGKKCLVRVDFNVPTSNGQITDETRILGALPTIKYLSEHNAKVILCSHFGKPHNVFTPDFKLNKKELATLDALPESERDSAKAQMIEKAKGDVKKFSLEIVANRLKELLDCNVTFAHDTIGEDAQSKVSAMHCGDVVLLENTRFYAGEEKCDVEFCRSLARFADVFVNDAFGTAHRSHASTAGIVEHGFVKDAVCGFLIEKEISVMANALESPVHPFVAVLGGAKIADKLNVIDNLLDKCDSLIIGGGMAYTFLKAQGYGVGNSLVDDSKLEYCANMLAKAKAQGKTIYLPVDTVVADHFPEPKDAVVATKTVNVSEIPSQSEGLDIGAESQKLFADVIKNAKTVIWNGPMGVFENPCFAQGTLAVAKAMAESSAVTIVGGGDSVSAVTNLGFADKVTHVSTGGGASLELFEGKTLPGIACLNEKN